MKQFEIKLMDIIQKYKGNKEDILDFIKNNKKRNKEEVINDLEYRINKNISIKRIEK